MRQHPPFFAFSVEQRRGEEVDVTFGAIPNTSLRKVFYSLLSLQSETVRCFVRPFRIALSSSVLLKVLVHTKARSHEGLGTVEDSFASHFE